MDALLQFFRKLSYLFHRQELDRDLADEMAFHREQVEAELRSDGVTPQEARSKAIRQFGNARRLQEETVDVVRFRFESVWQDTRYAARQLLKTPAFSATAVVVLALGIGATTAIFSAVNPILFAPLPYPEPRSLAMLWEHRPDGGQAFSNFADYRGLVESSRSFEAVAALKAWQPTMTGPHEPERLEGQRVSAPYLRVLGIQPAIGRDFTDSEDVFHGANVVILSDKLWRRRFAANPAIVGQPVKLDDELFTVVGVMPTGFENVVAPEAELWAPLQYNAALPPNSRDWGHHLRMIGRLRAGVSRAQARSEVDVAMQNFMRAHASGYDEAGGMPPGFLVNSLQDDLTRGVRPALLALLGAVLLVLIIACVNVTNLLLARAAQRQGEMTLRAALGASDARIARQLTTESLLLALVGGTVGMVIARLGVRALIAVSPADLPRLNAIRLDSVVFLVAALVTTLTGLFVGLVPALYASRTDSHEGLQGSSRRTAGSHLWTRRTLVAAEVSITLVLLVSAGLLLGSMRRLFAVDPGFDASHVVTVQVQESGQRYRKDSDRLRFFDQALERVRQVPGVVSAGFTSQLPLSGDHDVYSMMFEGENTNDEAFFKYNVTPGYLEAMRIPLIAGRLLNEQDMLPDSPRAVVINESFAKRKLPGQNPIGRLVCLRCGPGKDGSPWSTIVGVVGDVRQLSLELKSEDAVYVPNSRWYWAETTMSLVVRARGDAASLVPAIRSAIWAVDKDQPIVRVATMQTLVTASQAQRRFAMIILEVFALVALLLAVTGLYGVLAGSVTERTREIGVRVALGATPTVILRLVVGQGVWLTLAGIAGGMLGAVAASRALISLLFGISRLDPTTYVATSALLVGISIIACWLPAWRAAHVDPAVTLRAE
jgi:putative ABC transport system permease protein